MGIDFSHCSASWGYMGFGRFRMKLWNSAGFNGDLYKLYEDNKFLKQINDNHALLSFFNHSDCHGDLYVSEMKEIIPVMESILKNWDKDDYDTKNGLKLIDGMKLAVSKNEKLKFC